MTIMVIREADGSLVKQGDLVRDFRGDPAIFQFGSRPRVYGKSGKVVVKPVEEIVERQANSMEYNDSVFDLIVVTESHCTACHHEHFIWTRPCDCGCTTQSQYGTRPMVDAGIDPATCQPVQEKRNEMTPSAEPFMRLT